MVALGLGALAVTALIIRRRTAADATRESYNLAGERFDEPHPSSREATEEAQERRREEHAGVLTQDIGKTDRSIRDDLRSIVRGSVSRSAVVDREASQAGIFAPEARTGAEELPIEDYDSLSVRQIVERLDELIVEEIERLLNYEIKNKNRRTLIARLERRIKKRPGEDMRILRRSVGDSRVERRGT
jgi:hypothetical protein